MLQAPSAAAAAAGEAQQRPVLPVNIVMVVVGTRGDVQPFVSIGRRLAAYGHRVRLATHSNFRSFVEQNGAGEVEFYPLGGDPHTLVEFMVKNR